MPESRLRDNNTIGLMSIFSVLGLRKAIAILPFDTLMGGPYKRGSHGERGVPETSRVLAAEGFATQLVPLAPAVGLDPRVVCSMHRLLGKGYAGGGECQLRPSGWCGCFRRR